jgi:uncharacterized membrane protein
MTYINIEIFYRNHTDRWMFLVGGLCALLIGKLNSKNKYSVLLQSILGTLITLMIEFISGYILNIQLGLNIWDYSDLPLNILGQISLLYGIFWLLLCPTCIWLDDQIRFILYQESEKYSWGEIYKEFFMDIVNLFKKIRR